MAVAEHISLARPLVVLLQEVIPPQLQLLTAPQTLGEHYDCLCPENPRLPYYCAILLDRRRASMIGPARTKHFATSQMGRHMLSVDLIMDGHKEAPLTFITTHLESMKTEKVERVNQLTQVFKEVADRVAQSESSGSSTVIVAGDLNVRDDEVVEARRRLRPTCSAVDNIIDTWLWSGLPKDHEYTWDTTVNTNLGAAFKSRCRFDRCFWGSASNATVGAGASPNATKAAAQRVHSTGASAFGATAWQASRFELVGRERVPGIGRFASDHWGVQVTFRLDVDTQTSDKIEKAAPPLEAAASASPSSVPPAHATAGASGGAVDAEEQRRRRELAAHRAEARRKAAEMPLPTRRRISDVRSRPVLGGGGSATAASSSGAALRPSQQDVAKEDEEKMMREAIALSLQQPVPTTITQEASQSSAADGEKPKSVFSKGLVGQAGSAAIELD